MSRLFVELYLDEDVNVLIAELVRGRGFSATTALAEKQIGKTDAEQLAYAVNAQKAILTHNRVDFEALAQQYAATQQDHFGIIIATRRSPFEIARRVLPVLNTVTADEMLNQLRYI